MTEEVGRAPLRRRASRTPSTSSHALADKAGEVGTRAWEATNLLTISTALAEAARLARGDPRLALARGLPGPRRRPLVRPLRRDPRRVRHRGRFHARARRRTGQWHEAHVVRRPAGRPARGAAEAGLDPRAVYDDIVGARRGGPAGRCRGHHQRGHDPGRRPGRRRLRRPRGRAWSPAWASPPWSSPCVLGDEVEVTDRVADGSRVAAGDIVMRVSGPTRGLLTAERTALNFASHLSGVATATSRWVEALEGTKARVLDTRKTLPNWRALQKYAVRCGGGVNHRFGLSDMAMVKDNHVLAAGGVVPAFEAVRAAHPGRPGRGRGDRPRPAARAARRRLRADPARQHDRRPDGRGRADHRRPRHPRGLRRPHPRARPRRRGDRRRLHLRRCADPLGRWSSTSGWTCGS